MDFAKIFKSIVTFVKENKVLLISLVVVIIFFWQYWINKSRIESLLEENQNISQQTAQDLSQMRTTFEQERLQQEEINRLQAEQLTQLSEDYRQRLETLEARIRTRRTTFVRETEGNPGEMASRLTKRLGWRTPE